MPPIGFVLPFARSTGSIGLLETTRDELTAVGMNLKSLLLTNWGERVMHQNLGCNLIEFLFSNENSNELRERISDRIVSQVGRWMPFVVIDDLSVVFAEEDLSLDSHAIGLRIKFRLVNKPDLSSVLSVDVLPS